MASKGVLLVNVGTPDAPTAKAVKNYLRQFLLDKHVIDLPWPLRQFLVRGIILNTRPKKVAPKYSEIWQDGQSPLLLHSKNLQQGLQQNPQLQDYEIEIAMRYGNPSIKSGLEKLKAKGVEKLLIAPLYPQYAEATTITTVSEAKRVLKKMNWDVEVNYLEAFYTDDNYISALKNSCEDKLTENAHLLFSYHGLPHSHILRQDSTGAHCLRKDGCCSIATDANKNCYAHHCTMTSMKLADQLGLSPEQWSQSYQSRLGKAEWLSPSTNQTLVDLAKKGIKNLVVISPAFVVDGLETLEELEIEARAIFKDNGGEQFTVIPCLNSNEDWVEGLGRIITNTTGSESRW